jgi:hypothetical protein
MCVLHVAHLRRSENRQTGGGCVGGVLTSPCNVSRSKDSGDPLVKYRGVTVIAGKMAPARVMHFKTHAVAFKWS